MSNINRIAAKVRISNVHRGNAMLHPTSTFPLVRTFAVIGGML